jgi:hypothetical protein
MFGVHIHISAIELLNGCSEVEGLGGKANQPEIDLTKVTRATIQEDFNPLNLVLVLRIDFGGLPRC